MKTEKWWQSYEKDWLMRRWSQEIKEEDMKHLRRLYWHLSDDMGLALWALAVLLGGSILWITVDLALSLLR